MKKTYSLFCTVLPFLVVMVAVLGCNQSTTETTSNGNVASTTTTSNSTATSPPTDIAGSYEITGTNENGAGQYKGTLAVTNRGDVYQFSWNTAGKKYDGVGVRTDNAIGVAFAEGDDGKGCGVVLYKIGADGTLDGKAGYWGNNTSETETAKRTSGTDLDGQYDVSGKNIAGNAYTGKLAIKPVGAGYTFAWSAGVTLDGFGVKQGDKVAAGIGGAKCGFVAYEVGSDGTLTGKWGGYGSRSVGIEVAKKR